MGWPVILLVLALGDQLLCLGHTCKDLPLIWNRTTGRARTLLERSKQIIHCAVASFFFSRAMRLQHSGDLTSSLRPTNRHRVCPHARFRQLTHSSDKVELTLMLNAAVDKTLSGIPGARGSSWLRTKPIVS